jgi:ferredoxin
VIRIEIDRDRCVGSGNCLFWAPGTFDLDSEGVSVVIDPVGDDEDAIRVAAEGCPTRAISIHDTDTDQHHAEGGTDADRPVR